MASRYSEEETNYLKQHFSSKTNKELCKELDRSKGAIKAKAVRLGLTKEYKRTAEHIYRKENLPFEDYSKFISTKDFNKHKANYVCGLVTAEGCFRVQERYEDQKRFGLSVNMSEKDKNLVRFICDFFEGGNDEPYHSNDPRENTEDCKRFSVQSRDELILEVVPLMEKYLRKNSKKWKQYENWRNELLNELDFGI